MQAPDTEGFALARPISLLVKPHHDLFNAYADCPRDLLPVTEDVGFRALGLPLWQDLTRTQITAIVNAIRRTTDLDHALELLRNLKAIKKELPFKAVA